MRLKIGERVRTTVYDFGSGVIGKSKLAYGIVHSLQDGFHGRMLATVNLDTGGIQIIDVDNYEVNRHLSDDEYLKKVSKTDLSPEKFNLIKSNKKVCKKCKKSPDYFSHLNPDLCDMCEYEEWEKEHEKKLREDKEDLLTGEAV